MSSLNRQQADPPKAAAWNDRLVQHITGIEQLLGDVNSEGAEEILDELYLLITKVLEQFPQLDKDED